MARQKYGSGWGEEFALTEETKAALQSAGVPEECFAALSEAVSHAIDYRSAFKGEPQESDKRDAAKAVLKAIELTEKRLREMDSYFAAAMKENFQRRFGDEYADLTAFERLLQMWGSAAYWASQEIRPAKGQRNDSEKEAHHLLATQVADVFRESGLRTSSTETGLLARTLRILFASGGFTVSDTMERYLPKRRKRA